MTLAQVGKRLLEHDGRRLAVGVLALIALVPLAVTPIVPLTDLGSTVGASGLLFDALDSSSPLSKMYQVNATTIPYWTAYVFLALVGAVVGPLWASKALVALCVLALPLSMLRLAKAIDRDWSMALVSFGLAWDLNLYWGWVTFHLGMSIAIWCVAKLIEIDSWKGVLKVLPLVALVGLTHAHAVVFLVAAAALTAIAKARPFRAIAFHATACLGLLVLTPWLWGAVLRPAVGSSGGMNLVMPPLSERVTKLFEFSLGYFVDQPGLTAVSVLFLSVLAISVVGGGFMRRGAPARPVVALAVFLAAFALYVGLPFEVQGPIPHWWTYPRFATYVLACLPLVANVSPTWRGRWAIVLVVVAISGWISSLRVGQFSRYGAHVRPYLELVEKIPAGTRFLPIDIEFTFPGFREPTLGQLHGFAAALRHAYDPHLFAHPAMPLLYREGVQPPTPNWGSPAASFTSAMALHYDYVLVYPSSRDTLGSVEPKVLELVADSGPWRLYKVTRPP